MYSSGSLGYMLQGVSQQPERVQPEGHVKQQINMVSDPNTGLASRAGGELIVITDAVPGSATHRTTSARDVDIRVSSDTGYVGAIDYEGTVYTILDPDDYMGYFGPDMAYYAQDSRIFCVNRQTVVAKIDTVPDIVDHWGFIQALGGEFSRTYTARVSYGDGTFFDGEYTTPDADVEGAAEAVTPDAIINGLRISLLAAATRKASTTIVSKDEVMYISDTAFTVTVDAFDAANNDILRAGDNQVGVTTFASVPKYAGYNAVLRVRGERGTVSDDVWLIFDIPGQTVAGAGFGLPGVWRETGDPDAAETLDRATMPHALDIDGTTMTIVRPAWEGRRVGNSETNPTPSFVGKQIKDIVSFQGRLAVIAGPFAIMTRTDNNLDFYRRTVTTQLATDPIDIRTAGEDDSIMQWLIPYDTNLIVAALDGQFFISGRSSLTSSNAAMPRSSNFEMSGDAKPVVAGQTVILPYNARAFSGVNEMLPTADGTANTIESLNNVTPKYIRGEIVGMSASANSRFLGLHTSSPEETNAIYVYNFLWENNTKAQSAWHKWVFPDTIQHVHTKNNTVYVWTSRGDQTWLMALKLDKPVEDTLGYHITGDYLLNVDTTVPVILPREDYKFVALSNGVVYSAGRMITPLSVTYTLDGWVYTLPFGVPDLVVAGVPVRVELEPNSAYAIDWRGNKKFNDTLIVQKFVLDYESSGAITALMQTLWRNDGEPIEVVNNRIIPAGDDPRDSFGTAVRTGSLEIPWGENSKEANLIIQSEGLQPINIIEIRWFGQVYRGKK